MNPLIASLLASQAPNSSNLTFTVLLLALIIVAIATSPKKWKTTLVVFGSVALGIGIGAAIGFAMDNMAIGGDLAAVLSMVLGLATSIREIVASNKAKKATAQKP